MSGEADRAAPSTLGLALKSVALLAVTMAGGTAQRMATAIAGWLAVAAMAVASLCFLTFAAHAALAQSLGAILASLIVGLAYLFLALATALVLQRRRR
jgi:drug/metabolite transporter (DMT)-like permease